MTSEQRIAIYTRGLETVTVDGIYRLTPKQRRRVKHKAGKAQRKMEKAK